MRWLKVPGSAPRKRPSNASKRVDRSWRNGGGDAIQALRTDRPDGRRGLRRVECSLRAAGFALALIFAAEVTAQSDGEEATRQFSTGRIAFQNQNYGAALESFEAALASGLSGPAVHFNIGVTAYRLGHYRRAKTAFREAARSRAMAALAHYNLGLVELKEGNSRAATAWFARAEQEATDERLRSLAATQLTELHAQAADRDWVGYGALGAGYDDNVALVSDSDVLGVSGIEDSFAELQLAFSGPLSRPWRLDAGLVLVDYQELDRFDLLSVQGGGRYRLHTGTWTSEIGLELAHTLLDGEGFESRRMIGLQASTALDPEWQLRTRYRYSDIDGLNEFDGLSGRRHEADARVNWQRGPWDLGLEYQFDMSDYDDDALSAQRHQLAIGLQHALPGGWAMALEATRRHSRYDLESSGSEDRTELGLAVTRILTQRWQLIVRYAYADNEADLAELDYQRNRISISLEAAM